MEEEEGKVNAFIVDLNTVRSIITPLMVFGISSKTRVNEVIMLGLYYFDTILLCFLG